MQRAEVVEHVAQSGKPARSGRGARPRSSAACWRQHSGALPAQALVRIWRELLAGHHGDAGRVLGGGVRSRRRASITQAAREHFGALTPLRVHGSPAQAMAEVSRGAAAVAVLPLPSETEVARDAWWTALLQKDEPRIHVIARLPFWTPRPDGAPAVQALVVAASAPDASGADRSLLGLELRSGRQPGPAVPRR